MVRQMADDPFTGDVLKLEGEGKWLFRIYPVANVNSIVLVHNFPSPARE